MYPPTILTSFSAGVAKEVDVVPFAWYRLWPGDETVSSICFMVASADDNWNTPVLKKIGQTWIEAFSPNLTISAVSKTKISLTFGSAYAGEIKVKRITF